jgi:hypothetical protein
VKRALLVLLLLGAPSLAWGAAEPAAAVKDFYAVYQAQQGHGGGIPDATGRLRYAAVLSPRLNKLLADAAAAQARTAARIKAGGPKSAVMPVLEGDIFTSLYDGASIWQVGPCVGDPAKSQDCSVSLTHVPGAGRAAEKPVHWTDHVMLVATPGGWKVDDVRYDENFAAGNTGQLTEMLGMLIASNP